MARKRREKTRYTGIYKQTGSNLYDVKYNFKEIGETTGETRYKAKWVYSIESLDLAKKRCYSSRLPAMMMAKSRWARHTNYGLQKRELKTMQI